MNVLVWLRDARKGMTKKEGEIRATVVCVHRDTDTQKKNSREEKSNNFCVRLSVCVRSMLVSLIVSLSGFAQCCWTHGVYCALNGRTFDLLLSSIGMSIYFVSAL